MRALGVGLPALLLLGYVLPAERVVAEMARLREKAVPVRVEVTLSGFDWPGKARLEIHANRGARVTDDRGARWVLREGRVDGASKPDQWLLAPQLLSLSGRQELLLWLREAGLDLSQSALARCGAADCFVLGGRQQPTQLWVEQETFEVRRFRSAAGWSVHFEGYRDWDGHRFPSRIRIEDPAGGVGAIQVESVAAAPDLSEADFSARWLASPGL